MTSPRRPGWYWDPQELEHNLALRDRWRHELILRERRCYRIRRWDGTQWTDDTLTEYTLQGPASVPHLIGPTTRIHPLTPDQASRNLRIWAVLMILATLAWITTGIVR